MAMYNIEELKELIEAVDTSSLTKFKIEDGTGQSIVMSKKDDVTYVTPQYVQVDAPHNTSPVTLPQNTVVTETSISQTEISTSSDNMAVIPSPMVGVFYSKPSPDAKPYVTVGTKVNKGEVICIVEAMKLMNEITATQSGVIAEICVNDGDVVEFEQPLFKLK